MSKVREALWPAALGVFLAASSGCSGFKSYWQRHHRAHYTITPEFYSSPPKTIAVLPITPRYRDMGRADPARWGAEAMREGFYRHVSVKGFEDMEMAVVDGMLRKHHLLDDTRKPKAKTYTRRITGAIKRVDVLGVTGLINPLRYAEQAGLTEREAFGGKRFEKKKVNALKIQLR